MRDGVVQQFGSPRQIYDEPANLYVAGFIGSPSMNFLRGRLTVDGGLAFALEHQGRTIPLPVPAPSAALRQWAGKEVILGIRPEHVTDADSARRASAQDAYHPTEVDARVELTEPTGPDTLVFSWFNGVRATCRTHPRANAVAGWDIKLAFDLSRAVFFDPDTELRIA
jgi:multiple sugar transport system ATP-binding protein